MTRSNSVPMASDSETPPTPTPNKRPKTLTQTTCSPPPSSSSKGKHKKIDDDGSTTVVDSESQSCGICLSEGGKAIRGRIDSCDHYFCFVCIMEWAKVESRCPLCKRRFSTIRRPPKDGVFLAERVVNVPVRDQIFLFFGNATVGPPDPYSEVRCVVCDGARDESLLLLCDLCDSASHTYCVGLGATVPEGDWFCQDCTVSKAEHDKNETDTDYCSQTSFRNFHKGPPTEADVSILNIVRESRVREVERPTSVLPHPNQLLTPTVPERRTSLADTMTEQGSGTYPSVAPTATELGARTLRQRRNVHGHIRALRENWNAFRHGSLIFSSSPVSSSSNTNQRHSSVAILCDKSAQPHSTPCSSQHLTAQMGSSSDSIPNRSSYDIDKAWKMMDAAKSMKRAHERTSTNHQSKHPVSKVNTTVQKANSSSSLLASSSKPLGTKDLSKTGPQKHYQHYSLAEGNDRDKSQTVVKQKQSLVTTKRISKFGESSPSAQSPGDHELPSSRSVLTSVQVDVLNDGSACLISPAGSVTAASKTYCAKPDVSSSSKMGLPNGKAMIEKSLAGSKSSKDDEAKSEIQSLVKLNLKVLTKDRKLGNDAFKEIARLATHSILATCGLEHPKPGVRSFPSSICHHSNQGQQLHMSTLLPSSCRGCFYIFVKDVVNAIVVEKIGSA